MFLLKFILSILTLFSTCSSCINLLSFMFVS